MTKQEFIAQIAKYVQKYAPSYDIKVYSPIIAQACLESAYGTSELATKAHNYFGLKYSSTVSEKAEYVKVGSEQNADGSYTSSTMKWCNFSSLEKGVEGYFKFLFGRNLDCGNY
jgi:flagellum-specific peptidoglycan hydrolase FlgJ